MTCRLAPPAAVRNPRATTVSSPASAIWRPNSRARRCISLIRNRICEPMPHMSRLAACVKDHQKPRDRTAQRGGSRAIGWRLVAFAIGRQGAAGELIAKCNCSTDFLSGGDVAVGVSVPLPVLHSERGSVSGSMSDASRARPLVLASDRECERMGTGRDGAEASVARLAQLLPNRFAIHASFSTSV